MKTALLLITLSFSVSANDWDDYASSLKIENNFVDSKHLIKWEVDSDVVMDRETSLAEIKKKPFACKSDKLWPAHPSQATKNYLWARYAQYNHATLPASSYACLTPNPSRKFCLRGAIAKAAILSDTYVDECNNYYRGYWIVTYLRSDENMGTLYAKGRRGIQNPSSEYDYDFIDDTTYFVSKDQFLFFGELLSTDARDIQNEVKRALKGGMKKNGLEFVR